MSLRRTIKRNIVKDELRRDGYNPNRRGIDYKLTADPKKSVLSYFWKTYTRR